MVMERLGSDICMVFTSLKLHADNLYSFKVSTAGTEIPFPVKDLTAVFFNPERDTITFAVRAGGIAYRTFSRAKATITREHKETHPLVTDALNQLKT